MLISKILNRLVLILATFIAPFGGWGTLAFAQSAGYTGYEFLDIPTSAHCSALGGNVVTLPDDDVTMIFYNPALLPNTSHNTANFDVTTYISSSVKLSAAFARQWGSRANWAVGMQLMNYGKMTETTTAGEEIGEFSPKDINVQGTFSYLLSEHWAGGVNLKLLFQNYANYNAVAMGVDLGINYVNEKSGTSASLVAQNLGGELKSLYDERQTLPAKVTLGISQELKFIPVKVHLTIDDLFRWHNLNFWQHLIIGADVRIIKPVWVGLGFNIRRAHEMSANGSSHAAGLNVGAGLDIKKIHFSFAYGKYHIGANSFVFNLAYNF